jgi:hypothetical protein
MQEAAPIGACEDHRTEFKRQDALRKLEPISHAVVSMLNAAGGNVWIGVIEQDERWVGVEPIADAENEARRLQDHLIATIEPSPHHDEVRVEPFSVAPGQSVLVARVAQGKRKPYAQLKAGGRHFVLRVGGRSRPMTHSELVEAFSKRSEEPDRLRARSEEAWQEETHRALQSGYHELWVRVDFDPALALPRDRRTPDTLTEWLHEPPRTGNRAMGWTFASAHETFTLGTGRRGKPAFTAGGAGATTWLDVGLDGEIAFRVSLERLAHRAAGELYPYALVEFPVSVMRLAATLRRTFGGDPSGDVLADVALIGARGMRIPPGSPRSIAYGIETRVIEEDSIRPEPHRESVASLLESPDAFAWRALTALYFSLGLLPDRMPLDVYDERHRKIHFPR